MTGGADDARQRAAATLRNRSRNKLLTVARDIFDSLGWEQTKVIDVAAAAGLSEQTAYNHFKTKQGLAVHAYAPLVEALTDVAQDDIMQSRDAVEAVQRFVSALAGAVSQHPTLAIVVLLPVEGDEPRLFGQLVEALARLVQEGARQGVFTSRQPAYQIARYHIRALLSLAAMGDNDLTQLALSQMLPALMSGNP